MGYGRFVNCLGLVTFPLATVFVVVFVVTFSCIFIKLLSTRGYLISFLRHFCPTGVNTKESLYYWGWIPKPMMDIYTQRGSRHRWDRWSAFRYKRFTKAGFSLHTRKRNLRLNSTEIMPWSKGWPAWSVIWSFWAISFVRCLCLYVWLLIYLVDISLWFWQWVLPVLTYLLFLVQFCSFAAWKHWFVLFSVMSFTLCGVCIWKSNCIT